MSANSTDSDTSGVESVVSNSIQEPSSGLVPHRCVVISLIRHAQCCGNVNKSWTADDAPNPLTETGRLQADSLGRDWADTHIDHLLSSPLQRAYDTAKALSSHNGHPEIDIHDFLSERRYGDMVPRLMRFNPRAGRDEIRGTPFSRSHCPAEGGESMNLVAWRAETIIRLILSKYAVNLSEAPEFFLEKKTTDAPAILPDGIPHVVIVSHNIFLMELYEKMRYWGKGHMETNCDWKNADWSRHILWYDEGSDKLDFVDMKYCREDQCY